VAPVRQIRRGKETIAFSLFAGLEETMWGYGARRIIARSDPRSGRERNMCQWVM
jgi:hypothetical protein